MVILGYNCKFSNFQNSKKFKGGNILSILIADTLTNGVITNIIEQVWIAEKDKCTKLITANELELIHNSLKKHDEVHQEIFRQMPESVYVPLDTRNQEANVEFYHDKGFILDDGISAAAGGSFKYIYRAKGMRTLWFENGIILECTIYSTLDGDGFQMYHQEIDGIDFLNPETSYDFFDDEEHIKYGSPCHNYRQPLYVISKLLNIKKAYNTAYYIEYLLDPPDVQIISDFSIRLKKDIWSAVLNLGIDSIYNNVNPEYKNLFKFCIGFMDAINQDVDTEAMINFCNQIISEDNSTNRGQLQMILDEIRYGKEERNEWMNKYGNMIVKIADKKEDIIDIKPNFAGIGLNLNPVCKKIKNFLR